MINAIMKKAIIPSILFTIVQSNVSMQTSSANYMNIFRSYCKYRQENNVIESVELFEAGKTIFIFKKDNGTEPVRYYGKFINNGEVTDLLPEHMSVGYKEAFDYAKNQSQSNNINSISITKEADPTRLIKRKTENNN